MQTQSFYSCSFLSSILFFFISFNSFGQDNQARRIGVSLAGEMELSDFNPTLGVFGIHDFTAKSAIEVGVFFRTKKRSFLVDFTSPSGSRFNERFNVIEGYLNFPILYRFTTRFANFSLGPTVDLFSSWNQTKGDDGEVTDYSISPRVKLGPLLKIGRNIPIKGSLVFEPELRMGLRSVFRETFIGVGVRIHQQISPKE